jgi:hypothetical protein
VEDVAQHLPNLVRFFREAVLFEGGDCPDAPYGFDLHLPATHPEVPSFMTVLTTIFRSTRWSA